MKKFLSSALIASLAISVYAQSGIVNVKMQPDSRWKDGYRSAVSVPYEQTHVFKRQMLLGNRQPGGSRTVTTVPLGSAGNLFTILDGHVQRIAVNNDINTVAFIHRSNPTEFPLDNVGQYRYDVSFDNGATWSLNHGVLNPSGNQQNLAGRYPNNVIYNPPGNTNPDSAYLGYLGSWLPFDAGGSWDGYFAGVARLDNDTSTFTENVLTVNNSNVNIIRALCNGKPGEFWAVDWGYDEVEFNAILLMKGVWNNTTKDIDWSLYDTIVPPFDRALNGTAQATALNMAFDPTGRYGWIAFLGDVIAGGDNIFLPVFYSSTDSGMTWNGPIVIRLDTFANVVDSLVTGTVPTTAFDNDLVVDAKGNPHLVVVIGSSGNDYAISTGASAGLKIYDVTFVSPGTGGSWQAILLDNIFTFRGQITPDVSEDNRPQAAISPDGQKVFFGWLESDVNITGGTNDLPNFKTRAYDINTGLGTPVINWTENDNNWNGGALFASTAAMMLTPAAGVYRMPTVFTQLNSSGLDADPTNFHYVQDIEFTDQDFTEQVVPAVLLGAPVITLLGPNPAYSYLGEPYNDPGATAFDQYSDGDITNLIQVVNNVNTAVRDTYTVVYTVTDSDNKSAAPVTRTVIVNTEPDPDFDFTVSNNTVFFTDASLYNPTAWSWNFGDQTGANVTTPTVNHTYTDTGTYRVCMTAKNIFNNPPFNKPAKDTCKNVTITEISTTGISTSKWENALIIYPNPARDQFVVEMTKTDVLPSAVAVYDMLGKQISLVRLSDSSPRNRLVFETSSFTDGVYFIKLFSDQGVVSKKIVVSHY
ncbi:MAG: hypothetical protein KatS3mg031_2142 [Chitinophagales bacterium]|nr:MAG: hypothetical protein KatS3mg031_2142 [Chitinophagales bacterium]